MGCLSLGLTIPVVPSIFLGVPLIPPLHVPPLPFNIALCCHFTIPDPGLNVAIAALNAAIKSSFPAAVLMPIIMSINEVIAVAQQALDAVQLPNCPLE